MACLKEEVGEFICQLESARAELREKFSRTHQLLQESEDAILKQLYQLEETYNEQHLRRFEEMQELLASKEKLQFTIKKNKNQNTLFAMLAPLETKLEELRGAREELQDRVILIWNREDELEEMIRGICSIELGKLSRDNVTSTPYLWLVSTNQMLMNLECSNTQLQSRLITKPDLFMFVTSQTIVYKFSINHVSLYFLSVKI